MNKNHNPRGSEWKKWDLHVHSPVSRHYKGTFNDLRDQIKRCEADVIGVNDYSSLEGYESLMQEPVSLGGKVLFPVVELRMHNIVANRKNPRGGALINFHLIFDNEEKVFKRAKNFLSSLRCYNAKGENEQLGNISKDELSKVTFDYERVIDELRTFKLRESVLVWLPYDEYGGIDDIDPEDNFFKLGLIKKADIIGSSYKKQIDFFLWKDSKFTIEQYEQWFDKPRPCIKGSDTHEANYPIGRLKDKDSNPTLRYCWIKADPTFEGLKQIVHEPENRVFLGELPPKLEIVKDNKERFIDKIQILSSQDDKEWFDNIGGIPLNTDLISIIGNKGNGKSALADIIACAGNSNTQTFSFLNPEKFLALSSHTKYSAMIEFHDGFQGTRDLGEPFYDYTQHSKVVYLSQYFVRDLCEAEDVSRFQDEIFRVIHSHIPEEESLDAPTVDELISQRTRHIKDAIVDEQVKLNSLNKKIEKFENYQKREFRETIQNKLKEKERQLESLKEKEKPEEVPSPDKSQNQESLDKIRAITEQRDKLIVEDEGFQKDLNDLIRDQQEIETAKNKLDALTRQVQEFIASINSNETLKKNAIHSDGLISFSVDTRILTETLNAISTKIQGLRKQKAEIGIAQKDLLEQIRQIQQTLTEKEKAYQNYLQSLKKWEEKQIKFIGDEKTEDTIRHYQRWIEFLDHELETQLRDLYVERSNAAGNIIQLVLERKRLLQDIYVHAQSHIIKRASEFGIPKQEFIDFDCEVKFKKGFETDFLEYINQNRTGTFYGRDEGLQELKKIMNSIDRDNPDSIRSFPEKLIKALKHNLAADPIGKNEKFETLLENQLIAHSVAQFYDYLFSFDYLEVNFLITYAGKRIPSLSPGERGTLLLIFYLLIDKDNRPIIIDQPEENLDNETIYRRLVAFLKKAKNERQIIIVTHNPNLAIVCDSEQIIHTAIDKENRNLVTYSSGSIEYSYIREQAVNILEGTQPAFMNRKEKYDL